MLSAFSLGAKDNKEYAEATFSSTTADLGFIREEKGIARCEFELTNTGNSPLIIIEAKASCGCTNPEFPTRPIAPGKKAKIKVKFNPAGGKGGFRKTIIVKDVKTVGEYVAVVKLHKEVSAEVPFTVVAEGETPAPAAEEAPAAEA